MIYHTAAALLLAVNLTGSGDTPIEPITSDVVTLTIATSDDSQQICDVYPSIVAGIDSVVDDYDLAQEIVDAWATFLFEDGYSAIGDARMTVEAQDVFLDWLHSC